MEKIYLVRYEDDSGNSDTDILCACETLEAAEVVMAEAEEAEGVGFYIETVSFVNASEIGE